MPEEIHIMNKLTRIALCAGCAVLFVTGCSSRADDTSDAETAASAAVTDEELTDEAKLVLGEYMGLEMSAVREEVTDDMIQDELDYLCYLYPIEVTDRAAVSGDVANIDYVGYLDGETFSGGSYEGYDLTLGSGTFIDGFEDGVVGMMPGEERDIELTFPEDYGSSDLAGQDVVFHVTLNHIKDAANTEVDDALARRVTGDFSATVDTLMAFVEEELNLEMDVNYFNEAGVELVNKVIENSEITADPDAVEERYDEMYSAYSIYAYYYGLDMDTFLSIFLGLDDDGLRDLAENLVMQSMVLDAIIEKEGLVPTDEDRDIVAKLNYYDSAEELIENYGEENAEELFLYGAAYNFLIDNSVPAEAAAD